MVMWRKKTPKVDKGAEAPDFPLPEIEKEQTAEELAAEKGKINEATAEVKKRGTRKNKIITSVLFAVNILVVVLILWWQVSSETIVFIENLNINVWFLVFTILIFAVLMFFETFPVSLLIKKETGRIRWGLSYKVAAIGRYYDCITPLSTGGQPFQIYYMKAHGVPTATAISIPMSKSIFIQLMWQATSVIVLLSANIGSTPEEIAILVTAIIGFAINLVFVAFIIVVSLNKKFGEKLVSGIVHFLQKLRIVKNYDKMYTKIMGVVTDYQNVMKAIKDEVYYLIGLALSTLSTIIIRYTIPFFVYAVFAGGTATFADWAVIFSMSMIIDLAASFIPLPGGTGVSELSFTVLFAMFFTDGTLFWALILWRFMTYYIYIVQGLFVIIYDYVYGNKKYLWRKKSWQLKCESKAFKQEQVQKFRLERDKRRRK